MNHIGFTTENVNIYKGEGTSLQGYTVATRRKLESTFAEPCYEGEGDKTTTEWEIEFSDGTIATIYDWKRYELGAPAMDECIEWHIGGSSPLAVDRVVTALAEVKA